MALTHGLSWLLRSRCGQFAQTMARSSRLPASPYLPCLLLLIDLLFDVSEALNLAEVNRHLELGKDFLARGELSDALTHYHAAVEGDPNNYLTYYKRGTVYFALGKAKFAISDFSKVLDLKPDFTAAKLQRANVNLKLAALSDAAEDYYDVLIAEPLNDEANAHYHRIPDLIEDIQLAEAYYRGQDFSAAIDLIQHILEQCPWASHIRQLRAECYIAQGDILAAVSDIRSVNRLQQDSTDGYFRLATLLYAHLGHVADSLKEIRECLKLDPEHKDCFPLYKKIKKVDKFIINAQDNLESKEYQDCIENAEKILKVETEADMVIWEAKRLLCVCSNKDDQYTIALGHCKEALDILKDVNLYCEMAESLIGLEMYDDAIHKYQDALGIDDTNPRAKEGVQRAQKLQKQAEKRDYYKILDVKRSATKQEIVKAYRRAAQKWHPDNFQGEEKKVAERRFIDVAAAKEVLTDPEKRAQFDAGDDPLDPEAGRSGPQGNPFHQFQYGSPFQFKFHFN